MLHVRRPVFVLLNTAEASKNQWLIKVEGWFHTNVLDSMFPFIAQHIESQAVFVGLDQINKLLLQMDVLLIVDRAFENRILDSLAKVQALLCNVSQATLASFVTGRDVVSDKDQHWMLFR